MNDSSIPYRRQLMVHLPLSEETSIALRNVALRAEKENEMSWSMTIETRRGDVAADVRKAELEANERGDTQYESREVQHQLVAAIGAAENLIHSTLPSFNLQAIVRVRMGGHANPDHLPAAGWSNDYVSVEVTQLAGPPQPPGDGDQV